MSCYSADDDGFTLVTKKKGRPMGKLKTWDTRGTPLPEDNEGNSQFVLKRRYRNKLKQQPNLVEDILDKINDKMTTLKAGSFYAEFQPCLDAISTFAPKEIVCYGLGSLMGSQVSQWQLALLLVISQHFPDIDISAFDPAMQGDDKITLDILGITMIAVDEEAKRSVTKPTLFYMPHCEQFLYNNVLSANWTKSQLPQIMIVGNHFDRYKDRSSFVQKYLSHMFSVPFPSEKLLKLRHCPYAFTDTCVIQVDQAKLQDIGIYLK